MVIILMSYDVDKMKYSSISMDNCLLYGFVNPSTANGFSPPVRPGLWQKLNFSWPSPEKYKILLKVLLHSR